MAIPIKKQQRIIKLLKEGLSGAKVAKKLGISEPTVVTYRKAHKDELLNESILAIEIKRYRNILETLENRIINSPLHKVVVGIHDTDFFFEEYRPPQYLKPFFVLIGIFIITVLVFIGVLLKTI